MVFVPLIDAVGVVLTVTVTWLVALHPLAVAVAVYVVVAVGLATGFKIEALLKEVALFHEMVGVAPTV